MKITFSLSSSGLQVVSCFIFSFSLFPGRFLASPFLCLSFGLRTPIPSLLHSYTHTITYILIPTHAFIHPSSWTRTPASTRIHPRLKRIERAFVVVALNVRWRGRVVYGRPTNSPLASTHSTHIHTHIHPRTFISCGPHTATPVAGTPG